MPNFFDPTDISNNQLCQQHAKPKNNHANNWMELIELYAALDSCGVNGRAVLTCDCAEGTKRHFGQWQHETFCRHMQRSL